MTTELEEQFYKTFGIEPTVYSIWDSKETQIKNFNSFEVYPEITDHRLLQMICIIVQSKALLPIFVSENIENLKDEIIQMTIDAEIKFKHNNKIDLKPIIQQLFKENQ